MAHLLDALSLMKDRSFTELPWCDMDSLFMACLIYNRPGDRACTEEGITLRAFAEAMCPDGDYDHAFDRDREILLQRMGRSRRYGEARLCRYVDITDPARPIQFAAAVLRTPDGPSCVAFRGTDNTITGWREDLYMSFESPVPAQTEACRYLEAAALGEQVPIVVTGHSKGGNLSVYAAAHVSLQAQSYLQGVWSFDGPGLDDESVASQGYHDILDRVWSFMPQGSIVGLMMAYQDRHTIVQSDATGVMQHDPFSWQTDGLSFVGAERTTLPSQMMDRTLHSFLRSCTPEQRRVCVDAIFDMLEATHAGTMSAMKADKLHTAISLMRSARGLDAETVRVLMSVANTLVQSGTSSTLDVMQQTGTETVRQEAAELVQSAYSGAVQKTEQLRDEALQKAEELREEAAQKAEELLQRLRKD